MSHYVYALDNFSNAPFLVNHVHRLLLCAEMKCIQQCYLLLWAAADQKRQRYLERDLCWYWIHCKVLNITGRSAVECMVVKYAKLSAVTNIFRHLVDAYFCEISMPENLTCMVHDYMDGLVCLLDYGMATECSLQTWQ